MQALRTTATVAASVVEAAALLFSTSAAATTADRPRHAATSVAAQFAMQVATLFVPSRPLLLHHPRHSSSYAPRSTAHGRALRVITRASPRVTASVPSPPSPSSADHNPSDHNPSDHNPSDHNPSDHDARYARFSEFTPPSSGDVHLQQQLVDELLWAATRAATTQSMESTIQGRIDAVSELLSQLYSKSRRDLEQRNHELAIRTSLPSISKWNQQLIQRHKASKLQRSQISKELAIVHALLKRTSRSQSPSRSRRKSRIVDASMRSTQPRVAAVDEVRVLLRVPNALLFTFVLCAIALESFESVVSHQNGPSTLAQYSAFGALFVLAAAYLHALRSAHRRALHQLGKSSSPFINARGESKR